MVEGRWKGREGLGEGVLYAYVGFRRGYNGTDGWTDGGTYTVDRSVSLVRFILVGVIARIPIRMNMKAPMYTPSLLW